MAFFLRIEIFFRNFYLYFYFYFKDEREDVQKKTFAKWINSQLTKVSELVDICWVLHFVYSDFFIFETLPTLTIRSWSFMTVYVTAVTVFRYSF